MHPWSAAGARSSPIARLGLVVATALLVYASLFPITGWTNPGVSPFAWIDAPFPRYWVAAEIAFNVAVYAPFGLLAAWAVRPRFTGWRAVLLATLAAVLLSGTMESLQTYLPGRVASNVDFVANAAGGLLGAVVGAATGRQLIDLGWEVRWGEHILLPGGGGMVMLLAVWLLAQTPPQAMLFGTGDLRSLLRIESFVPAPLMPAWARPTPEMRLATEHACTAFAIVGATLLVLHCVRRVRMRALLAPLLVLVALSVKAASQPLAVPGGPDTFAWMTPGAWRGIVTGTLVAMALAYVGRAWQRRLAVAALAGQVVIVNLVPVDRYFAAMTASGRTGMLYAEAMATEIAALWPFAALAWMVWRASRPSRPAAPALPPQS